MSVSVGEVYFSYQLTWVVLDKGPLNVCVCVQENLSKPLRSEDIDASSGILMPYYDFDTKVMFLAGKVCIAFLRVYAINDTVPSNQSYIMFFSCMILAYDVSR